MDEKKIDKLYDLLERIEMEGDADTAASSQAPPDLRVFWSCAGLLAICKL